MQVLTGPQGGADVAVRPVVPQLVVRLAGLGLAAACSCRSPLVSQLSVFGTNADLLPLVDRGRRPDDRLGLRRGRSASASGCSSTSPSCRPSASPRWSTWRSATCAGPRARAARPPRAPLVPLAAGGGGDRGRYRRLRADAVPDRRRRPGELPARPRDPDHHPAQRRHRHPVFALVRRVLAPALPEDPRRRRRRAYTTGGLSPAAPRMIEPATDTRRPPITPQLALRVAVLGGIAFVLFAVVFFRLWYLQVLSRRPVPPAGARQPRARGARRRRRAATIVDATGTSSSRTASRPSSRSTPRSCPPPSGRRRRWGQLAGRRALRPKGKQGAAVAIPRPPRPSCACSSSAWPGRWACRRATIQQRIIHSLALVPYANVTVKVDVDDAARNYLSERSSCSRASTSSRSTCASTRAARWPRSSWARRARSTSRAQAEALPGRPAGDGHRQGRPRALLRPVPARARRLRRRSRSTRWAAPRARAPGARSRPVARLRTSLNLALQQTGQKYLGQDDRPDPGLRGRVRGDGPAQRQDPRARLGADVRPRRALAPDLAADLRPALRHDQRRPGWRPALQPRDHRRLSDGLDLQADHRAGRPGHGRDHARAPSSTTRAASRSAATRRSAATPRARSWAPVNLRRRDLEVLGRLLLQARPEAQLRARPAAAEVGAPARPRPHDRHRRARRVRRPRARPRLAQQHRPGRGQVPQEEAPPVRHRRRDEPPLERGRRGQPRHRPGRPAGHAAADGHRLRGDSRTAAAWCARTSASPSRTPRAASCSGSSRAPPRRSPGSRAISASVGGAGGFTRM